MISCRKFSFFFVFACLLSLSYATPWFGFSFKKANIPNKIASFENGENCLQIDQVFPQTGAESAGLQKGDILLTLDGEKVSSAKILKKSIQNYKPGKKVQLSILRSGKKVNLNLELGERPDDISKNSGSMIGSKIAIPQKNFYANSAEFSDAGKSKTKLILVDFWATWCGPCRQSLPVLAELYKTHGKKGLKIIGISQEEMSVLSSFQEEMNLPYPLYRDQGGVISVRYGISALPTMMILDGNGYLEKVIQGMPDHQALKKYIESKL